MSKFPNAIPLPDEFYDARKKREKELFKFACIGVSFRIAITIIELIGFYFTSSSSLFTDAISTLADVFSTFFLIICIKLAQRPPDFNHPFGHGRFEPFGGLILGLLFVVLGFSLLIQQFFGVIQHTEHQNLQYAWLFPFIAVILLEICYRLIMKVAKQERSTALEVDAIHYRIDSLTSLIAMTALLIAVYYPSLSGLIDHLGALTIASFMIIIGLYSCKNNFNQLMDKKPEKELFDKVIFAANQVEGVQGTEKTRIQYYGPDAHVDIDIEVDPKMAVEDAHEISQKVRSEIQKAWPAVRDVTVHIEPYYANDH